MVRAFNNSPQGPRKAPAVTVSSPLLNLDKMSMGSRLKGGGLPLSVCCLSLALSLRRQVYFYNVTCLFLLLQNTHPGGG